MSWSARLAAAAGFLGMVGSATASPIAWVQMTALGPEARAIVEPGACPSIQVDGKAQAMTERAAPTQAFPDLVCSAPLPASARKVSLEGVRLPRAKPRPKRIVILGDTGCRLKGKIAQSCSYPDWPFAEVSRMAAAKRPDLVIHVGDYYYRENACPAGVAGCAGSPFGDKSATWRAELFEPAKPLLTAAPWIFARGNHEDCARGGAGWFRQLDAAPEVRTCPAQSDTFAVDLTGVRVLVVDGSDADDRAAPADKVAAFSTRLQGRLGGQTGTRTWLLTHRPVWYAARKGEALSDGLINATERAALAQTDLPGVDLVISGHVHNFSALDAGPARPAQLIAGTGGDNLDDIPPPLEGVATIDDLPTRVYTMGRFGYFVLDRQRPDRESGLSDWVGSFRDLTDKIVARCRLHGRAFTCSSTGARPRERG
jgi:predicted phosphodiesterase